MSLLSGGAILGLGASLAIGGVAGLLQPRPRTIGALDRPDGRQVNIRQPASPTRVIYGRQMVGGVLTYSDQTGNNNEYIRLVITLCNHTITQIEGVYFDGKLVTEPGDVETFIDPYTDLCFIEINYGYDDQPALAQLIADTAADSTFAWTSAHRQRGYAHVYLRMRFDIAAFPTGLPRSITFLVQGKQVFDPRDDSTEYSANAALIAADYLTNSRFGLGMDYATRIDDDALIAAANLCDENMTIPDYSTSPVGTTTENRYEIHGVFETSERPVDVLERMAQAMAGHIVYVSGKWIILPGAYRAPSLTLDESDLAAPVQFQLRRSRRELPNGVKGTFVSPERAWKETDFPAVSDAVALAEDSDERVWLDLPLPFTISPFMAQRIAWIQLQRLRKQISGTITTMLQGYAVQPGNSLALTLAQLGWTAKEFEVEETSLTPLPENSIGVVHQLQETWDYSDYDAYQQVEPEEVPDNQRTDIPILDPEDCGIVGGVISLSGTIGLDRTPFCATASGIRVGLQVPFLIAEGGYFFGTAVYRIGTETARPQINVGLGRGGNFASVGIVLYQEFTIQNDGSTGPKVFTTPPAGLALDPLRLETGESLRGFTRNGSAVTPAAIYGYWSTNYKGDNGVILLGCNTGGQAGSTDNFHSIFGSFFEATEDKTQAAMPAGTLKRTLLQLRSAQPASGNQVITIRKNAVNTAHQYTIAINELSEALFPEIVSDVVFADGDLISVQDDNNATTDGAAGVLSMSYELATPGACLLGFRLRSPASASPTYHAPWVSLGLEVLTLNNCRFPLSRGFLLNGSNCRLVLATALTGGQTITANVFRNGVASGVGWSLTSSSPINQGIQATGSSEFDRGDDICIEFFGSSSVGYVSDITLMGLKRTEF